MIKNDREYRITKAQANRFRNEMARLSASGVVDEELDPLLLQMQIDAVQSQLADLDAEVEEYDALRSGNQVVPDLASFTELPRVLIKRRIAAGLSQRDLADRLGLKEQQVQRYEATEYASASFSRLEEVIGALDAGDSGGVVPGSSTASVATLFKHLKVLGYERGFVMSRLIPRDIRARLELGRTARGDAELAVEAAEAAGRVLRLSPEQLLGASAPKLDTLPSLAGVRFKASSVANERRLTAYTVYAHYLALLLLDATPELSPKPVPTDPAQIVNEIRAAYRSVNLESIIRYMWDLGIAVLPLQDAGAFHGACWRTGGRNVVVLKQKTSSKARWAFDASHELRHAGEEPGLPERSLVEGDESDVARWKTPEEQEASGFAGNVVLEGRAATLAREAASAAGRDIRRLKSVVPQVARNAGVQVDALANYMAFRLALDGANWWPTAAGLQATGEEPHRIVRDILFERVDMSRLSEPDRQLLSQALIGDQE
ncbi:MAG: helix-turn-helix transcriptional regulator [Chloroflexi bacterium]|nr:helix-turn-helix transcriptional regulator [Chloroflexota bacterium]